MIKIEYTNFQDCINEILERYEYEPLDLRTIDSIKSDLHQALRAYGLF